MSSKGKITNNKRTFFKFSFFGFWALIFGNKKALSNLKVSDFEKNTGFRNYGIPSKFEKIFRWIISNPITKGNGVSYTPLSKLHGSIVPNGLHFERHHYGVKEINPKNYYLIIEVGSKKIQFNLDQLKKIKKFSLKTFIECGGNSNVMYNKKPLQSGADLIHGLFSISEWTGVKLSKLFEHNKIETYLKSFKWLEFTSFDKGSYNISLPLKNVIKNGFLALYQNGEPIRPEQGYPVRLIIPGWEGSTHVKWLKKITFRNSPVFSRNETSRYTDLLPSGKSVQYSFLMASKSLILSPSPGQQIIPGKNIITGLAWSGSSYIKSVEITVDGGQSWFNAKLDEKKKAVVRFNFEYNWEGNEIVISSRCKDGKNKIQPSRINFLRKMGSNAYYHYSGRTSWRIDSNGNVSHTY